MKRIDTINYKNIKNKIESYCKEGNLITFNVISWNDGDGFFDLVLGDGGFLPEHEHYIKLKDKCFKLKNRNKLFNILEKYLAIKCFSSVNGAYKLGFDICITFSNYLLVFCPEFDEGYIAKLNFFERRFFLINPKENWDNKKFNYWEKRK